MRFKQIAPLVLFLLFFTQQLYSQSWGIGLRFGDPGGLTFKKYLNGKAFEFNIGRTGYRYKGDWYDRYFYDWYKRKGYRYETIYYDGYRRAAPWAFQFHFLVQKPLNQSANGVRLDWYYGIGAQLVQYRVYYDYRYKPYKGSDWVYVRGAGLWGADIGADGVLGLELKLKAPLSLFLDLNIFVEILDDPFVARGQGGFGGRYRF